MRLLYRWLSVRSGEFSDQTTVLLLPETYLSVDLRSFRGLDLLSLAKVVFNQNGYYTYGQGGKMLAPQLQSFYDDPSVP